MFVTALLMGGFIMRRPKFSTFTFSGFGFALLIAIALAAPDLARAQNASPGGPLLLNPTTVAFGSVAVGTMSPTAIVSATNTGKSIGNLKDSVSPLPFVIVSDTCPGKLPAGATCAVGIKCEPTATGSFTGNLTFTFGGKTQLVPLTCTGVLGSTPTATATATATKTATATATSTATATATDTATATATSTATAT